MCTTNLRGANHPWKSVYISMEILWKYMEILGNTWKYLEILGNTRKYLEILGNTWKYLEIFGNTMEILLKF